VCGILGALPAVLEIDFKKALDTLSHRGPDGEGIEKIGNDIILGHRRLSIIDLSNNAQQPMRDISNNYSIVFNGEIYNYLEIRTILEGKGYRFRSTSDTEVLLNAYIEWGSDCVLKLNGMWAFAIWNKNKKELFLSRDRFGQKPLFYHHENDRFIFSSEMKGIYPFLSELKESKSFDWMRDNMFLYESTEHCLIEGIKRFPAGHNGILKDGILKKYRYWNTLDHLVEPAKNYHEQVLEFRELFMKSCKLRMRSDVPIGTALSGGLDSSATISMMSHISKTGELNTQKDWQHAFVASFPGTDLDETKYAKMVVDHLGIKANYININPLKMWDNLEKYLYMFEELYLTSPIPMIMTYRNVKENGISVTIDGHGADELFSGYGHLIEALWDAKYVEVNDILNTIRESSRHSRKDKRDFEVYAKYMLKKLINKAIGRGYSSIDKKHPKFSSLDNFSKELYIIFHETILPTLLRNYDRYSMINSVEIRMPFMDHRLVSYVNSLGYKSKFGGGYTKKLIRDALDPYMPKEVTWRKSKIGFNSPIVDWMQNDLRDWFGDIVNSNDFSSSSLLKDSHSLKKRIEQVLSREENSYAIAEKAWSDLTPFLWEKAVLKRPQLRGGL
jgi:asparagine synthase (glutamine-hydrolysing)